MLCDDAVKGMRGMNREDTSLALGYKSQSRTALAGQRRPCEIDHEVVNKAVDKGISRGNDLRREWKGS
jgi:hypothetical protein